jgi:hypothetical protein
MTSITSSISFLSIFGMVPLAPAPPRSRRAQPDPFLKYSAHLRDDLSPWYRKNARWKIYVAETALRVYARGMPYMEVVAASGLHYYTFCAILRWYARVGPYRPKKPKLVKVKPKKVHAGIAARKAKWEASGGAESPLRRRDG